MVIRDLAAQIDEEPEVRSYRVDRFILYPNYWNSYPNALHLNWTGLKFTEENKENVPNDQKGVYSFVVDSGIANHPSCRYLFYIGKTDKQDFRTRYNQYLREESSRKPRRHIVRMIKKWPEHLWFYYAPVLEDSIIQQLEDDLLSAFIPPMNRAFPAHVRDVIALVFS